MSGSRLVALQMYVFSSEPKPRAGRLLRLALSSLPVEARLVVDTAPIGQWRDFGE